MSLINKIWPRTHRLNRLAPVPSLFDDPFFRDPFLFRPSIFHDQLMTENKLIDVQETDKEYLVKAQVPGFSENDIQLSCQGSKITIKGKQEGENENRSFQEVIQLPENIDTSKVVAKLKHGILNISVQKEAIESSSIPISVE